MADMPGNICVQVSSVSGEIVELDLCPSACLADVKGMLESHFAFPREYQKLCVGADLPEDSAQLSRHCVPGEAVLRMTFVKSVDLILSEIASDDSMVQDRVLERLIHCCSLPQLKDRRVLQVLLDQVADRGVGRAGGYVAVALRQLLSGHDEPCAPELLALLDHERVEVRLRGVEALGLCGGRGCAAAIEAARACLEDPVLSVRGEAIVALMHLGDAEPARVPSLVAQHMMSGSAGQLMECYSSCVRQGLNAGLQTTPEGLASLAAIAFYRDVRTFSPHSLSELAGFADDGGADAGVRGSALEVLWYLLHTQEEKGIVRGLSAAHACVAHRCAVVRHMAVRLIGTHGFRAGEACKEQSLHALHEALKDEDGRVQAQALEDIQAHLASTEEAELQRAFKMTLAESTRFLWSLKHMFAAGSNGSWLCQYAS